MNIRAAGPADAEAISQVVRSLSAKYIAPDCSESGVRILLGSMDMGAIAGYLSSGYRYHVAEDQNSVVGVVGTRENKHLYHLFVLDSHKSRGIARALWRVARDACVAAGNTDGFTVNSSRFAVEFYRKLGFVEAGAEENRNGVVSVPMRLTESDQRMDSDALLNQYTARVEVALKELAIPAALIAQRALPIFHEPRELVLAETGTDGKEYLLIPPAAKGWRRLSAAASEDGVALHIISAFRSIERQAEIIRHKLELGVSLDQILSASAPPGYSEHHSGRAVDVDTPGCPQLEADFENTDAFRWLSENAKLYSFILSFPRGNQYGYAYEPWHWCFHGTEV